MDIKRILPYVIGVLAILLVLSFMKDILVKVSVEGGVRAVTGLRLNIARFRVGLVNTLVDIRKLRLYNPAGFKDKTFLYMPEIYVDYDLPAFFAGKLRLEEMRIDMEEFVVIKNEKGELNLDSLKVVKAQKEGRGPEAEAKTAGGKAPRIRIDVLRLRIGKVVFKDYSGGGVPSVTEFKINLDERHENITNPYALVGLIVVKALGKTTIASLTNFDLKGLETSVSQALQAAKETAKEAADRTKEAVKKAAQKTEEVARKTTEKTGKAVKDTGEAIKKTFKWPFGSDEKK